MKLYAQLAMMSVVGEYEIKVWPKIVSWLDRMCTNNCEI